MKNESPEAAEKRKVRVRLYQLKHKKKIQKFNKLYHESHKEKLAEYNKQFHKSHTNWQRDYRHKHRDRINAWKREWNKLNDKKKKREAINHYGGVCYCCGESNIKFLCLDHINNGGRKHSKEIKGVRMSIWAKRNNYPPIFRVACHNCNIATYWNKGICPHKEMKGG